MTFDGRYRFSAHAVITNKDSCDVLQVKQTYGDERWGLPGGMVDLGETMHETVLRECMEELGVQVIIRYMSGIYFHSAFCSHVAIFRCDLPADTEITLSQEHSAYRYFPLDELSAVQRQRVDDCIQFDGYVKSASF